MLGCIEDPLSNFHSSCMGTSEKKTDSVKVYNSRKKLKSKHLTRISILHTSSTVELLPQCSHDTLFITVTV